MRPFLRPGFSLGRLALTLALALSACQPALGSSQPTPLPVSPSKEPVLLLTETSSPEPTPVSPAMPTPKPSPAPVTWWRPTAGLTWQWQIGDNDIDTTIAAEVYDVDLYVDQAIIDRLHTQGAKVICYISVGSWEDWRPDKDQFSKEVLGKDYEGWPGEKWLDIRQIDRLAPVMRARLDLCQRKGFDAIEPDNMEVFGNATGFPLTYADQLKYALWLAHEAHTRGLAIGQKNASDQVAGLVDLYDFAITEDYFYYDQAQAILPYIQANKPVFAAEYTDLDVNFPAACAWGREHQVSFILKNRGLDAWRETCPSP